MVFSHIPVVSHIPGNSMFKVSVSCAFDISTPLRAPTARTALIAVILMKMKRYGVNVRKTAL